MVKVNSAAGLFWSFCFLLALLGCEDGDDNTDLLKLSDAVGSQTSISLDNDIGEMTFHFTPALNLEQKEQMEGLLGDAVNLTVMSVESGVTCLLTSGTLVDGEPAGEGEYSFYSADGATVVLKFFNGFDGRKLSQENEYSALIEVANNSYFEIESFTVPVLFE